MIDLNELARATPFVSLMAANPESRPFLTKVIEQATPGILVGLTVAALGVWKSDALQDQKIAETSNRVERIEKAREIKRVEDAQQAAETNRTLKEILGRLPKK